MSDMMKPIAFRDMIRRVLEEYKTKGTIYGTEKIRPAGEKKTLTIFGETPENPLGIAAGPNTQLAHNILAAYAGGARFMELKTIQILFGEELGIPKPCIRAEDEGYNVEWSSEFPAHMARDEYIKAWFGCKVLAKELELGDPDGFVFNMSCGYNLEGIKSETVDTFINTLMDASGTEMFQECTQELLDMVGEFKHVDEAFIKGISPKVCRSITLSTMHGCPADEIEAIAEHLITEKKINTYIKCNPTLLGYDDVRNILDTMGYDYITFGKEQFDHDLKMEQAVPMIRRLQEKAAEQDLEFGVKLTNTFQVQILQKELPGSDMYMSGKALYPLSVTVAHRLSEAFGGNLPISFSGGADKNNIAELFQAGIWPITVATVILKPVGINAIAPLAEILEGCEYPQDKKTDTAALEKLAKEVLTDKRYTKSEAARKKTDEHKTYDSPRSDKLTCRVLCKNCVRVCPNRTNEVLQLGEEKIILHVDMICNECGNCQFFCVEPCLPYKDRFTLFSDKEMLEDSENTGVVVDGDHYTWRYEGVTGEGNYEDLPEFVRNVVDAMNKELPYLL